MQMQRLRIFPGTPFLIVLTFALSLAGCATPGVTKATGRVTDPPLELVIYCLLAPADPACRGLWK
jgi:hypothetical protein